MGKGRGGLGGGGNGEGACFDIPNNNYTIENMQDFVDLMEVPYATNG